MIDINNIVDKYLDKDDAKGFCNWAWGDDYDQLNGDQLCNLWNERHSKTIFKIIKKEEVYNTLCKMMLFWVTKVKK